MKTFHNSNSMSKYRRQTPLRGSLHKKIYFKIQKQKTVKEHNIDKYIIKIIVQRIIGKIKNKLGLSSAIIGLRFVVVLIYATFLFFKKSIVIDASRVIRQLVTFLADCVSLVTQKALKQTLQNDTTLLYHNKNNRYFATNSLKLGSLYNQTTFIVVL